MIITDGKEAFKHGESLVVYCTPEFYEEFAKRVAKLKRTEQIKKERIKKPKPYYTQLMGRWGQ